MSNKFSRTFFRFLRDEDGAFMVIFGMMAIVLVALSGSVVDYVGVEQARNRAQVALDAATLSLQPSIYKDTEANILAKAQALLTQQINNTDITSDIFNIDIDTTTGSLLLEARLTVPLVFVSLVGISEMQPVIFSEATRQKINLEVALVLDNSGSMGSYNRMTYLKTAAKNAVEILFSGEATQDNVFMGIVPFTTMVNVGSSHASESAWVDVNGISSVAQDNFDNDDDDSNSFTTPVNRLALYNALSNVSWRGCMEARPYPYSTNDTVPTTSVPDTMFVPAFAPDEPGDEGDSDSSFRNSYLDDAPDACNKQVGVCNCSSGNGSIDVKSFNGFEGYSVQTVNHNGNNGNGNGNNGNGNGGGNSTNCALTLTNGQVVTGSGTEACSCSGNASSCPYYHNGYDLSDREKQERLCKYTGSIDLDIEDGPNAGCPTASILTLNNTKATVKAAINAMTASGGTNIHQGAIWGFHLLSPTLPFDEGVGYDVAASKVVILMTDGENTFYTDSNMNNAQFNQAYGFPYNQREGDMSSTNNSMASRMNTLFAETCTNTKAAGIRIYTIGLSSPNTTTTNLLKNCASTPSNAHFPDSPSELDSIFTTIANELADLRLAR